MQSGIAITAAHLRRAYFGLITNCLINLRKFMQKLNVQTHHRLIATCGLLKPKPIHSKIQDNSEKASAFALKYRAS